MKSRTEAGQVIMMHKDRDLVESGGIILSGSLVLA